VVTSEVVTSEVVTSVVISDLRPAPPLPWTELSDVVDLVAGGSVLVLSGAGLSTESGIPDYRGPTGARRRGSPMTFQEFTSNPIGRQRYWARSHLGYRMIRSARPNAGHRAVAVLEEAGLLRGIITQNVDKLHQAAGAKDVVDLHGSLDRVVCLSCRDVSTREGLEARLREANEGFEAAVEEVTQVNPDGDVDLADDTVAGFTVVACERCGDGMLKPDVVFFGENVPRDRVERCYELVDGCSALVVLGSSLTVMSGYRFVRRAAKQGKPVAILNQGPTRGDEQATFRVDAPLGVALQTLVRQLPPA
jgi:NAD-dependent SIR2 family protein deacetylase